MERISLACRGPGTFGMHHWPSHPAVWYASLAQSPCSLIHSAGIPHCTAPAWLKQTSDLHGSNFKADGTKKIDFREKGDQAENQVKMLLKFNSVKIFCNAEVVIGSFWLIPSPMRLLSPFRIEVRYQLLMRGLQYPASKCVGHLLIQGRSQVLSGQGMYQREKRSFP